MLKNDYVSGQQLAAEDWNEIATLSQSVRYVLPSVSTYNQALAAAEGVTLFEIRVTADGDPTKNGLYHYNGTTGALVNIPVITDAMRTWILNMMQVDNPQNT